MTNDAFAVIAAIVASSMVVLTPAVVPPEGVWSFAIAAAVLIPTVLVRRRWAQSPRVQRVTTAVVTTCLGLGVLLTVAAAIQAFA